MPKKPKTPIVATENAPKVPAKAIAKKQSNKGNLLPAAKVGRAVGGPEFMGAVAQENEQLRLTPEQKIHIVTALACFVKPSEIRKELASAWNLDVSLQLLSCYDPTTRAGLKLREEFRQHFYRARNEYLARCRSYGVASQAMRLARLDEIFNRFMASGNLMAAKDVLKQIAKDVGGQYTSARMHAVKPDARQSLADILGISVDQLPEKPRHRN